jgi:predicted outer membrane repeat protein
VDADVNIADILLFENIVFASLTTQWGGYGGGIAFYNSDVSAKVYGKVLIEKSIIRANKASIAGGAMASSRVDAIELSHVLLEANEAKSAGAALFDDCPDVLLKEVVFRHNRALGALGGGAVRCTTSGRGIAGSRDAPIRASTNVVGNGVWFLENVARSGDGGALNIVEAVSSKENNNHQVIGGAPGISSFIFMHHSVKPTFKVSGLLGMPKHGGAIGHSYMVGDEISILGGDNIGRIRVTKVSTGDALNNVPAGGIVEWQVVKTGSSYVHYGRKGEYEVRNVRLGSKGSGVTAVVVEATVELGPIGPLGSEVTLTLDAIRHQGEAEKDRSSRDVRPCSGGSLEKSSASENIEVVDVPMCVFDASNTRIFGSSGNREDELRAGVLFTRNTALRGGALAMTGSTVRGALNFGSAGRGIILDNEASQSGGGVYIGVAGDGVATLRNLDIIGCSSSGANLAPADGGGGLYVGGSFVEKSPAFIGDCLFRNNQARGWGGGVLTRNADLRFEKFTQVQVYKSNPEKPKETIVVLEDLPVVTRFVNNRANAGGGVASDGSIVRLANSVFTANLAVARGGSIMVTRDPVTLVARGGISEADLVANPFLIAALMGNTITIEGGMAGQVGGAISATNMLESSIDLENLIIGADLARIPSASIMTKVVVANDKEPIASVSPVRTPQAVSAETIHAIESTSGVLGSNGFQKASALLNYSPKFKAAFPSAGQHGGSVYVSSVNAVRFKGLRSLGSSSGDGGTIYATSCPRFEIFESDLSGGRADFGGAIVIDRGSVLHVRDSRLRENMAEFNGGAICTRENAVVDLEQTVFERNVAKTGGAIYVDTQGSVRTSDECIFRDNFAHMFGGAVVLTLSTDMTVTRSTFWGNKANDDGGAIFSSDSTLVAVDTRFHYNAVKSRRGGGVLAERGTIASFDSCEFKGNVVRDAGGGGALAVRNHAQIRMSRCVLDRNRAGFGGAVFVNHNAKVYFARVVIKANTLSKSTGEDIIDGAAGVGKSNVVSSMSSEVGEGAGVFAGAYSTVELSDGTVLKDNVALTQGGGLYLGDNARLVIHNGISREAIENRVISQEAAWEAAKAGMDSLLWEKEALKWPWKEYLANGNAALGGVAHNVASRLGPNRVNTIAAEQALREAMDEADLSSPAGSGAFVFGLSRDDFKTQYQGEACVFERNSAGKAGGALYLTHVECDAFTDESVSSEFGKWTPPCIREGPGCSQNFRGTVERSMCVDVAGTRFRNNEAALGGAVFWKYIWNGKEFPVFTCEECDNDIETAQSGWNDIATDAISVGLGWFPNLETFESGGRLEDRSGIDALRVGHTYVRTMRCDEIGVQQPVLDLAIAKMCRDQGFDGNQCAVFYQDLHPAYARQVCTYFGWLPLGNVDRADNSLLDKHRVNVDNGCQKLRDELIYGGAECDEHCFKFQKGNSKVIESKDNSGNNSSSPAIFAELILPPLFELSRPLDGICGLEREMQITDTGETVWSVTSRRCNIATRKYETCKSSATNMNDINNKNIAATDNLNANKILSQCEENYELECPKICRKSERLTCAELSNQLELLTSKNRAKAAKESTANNVANTEAFVSTFSLLRSVDDFRLPLGPYVKALDYYGNPVTIDDTTRCTLIRRNREVPQAPSEAELDLIRNENNGTLPEGVLTAEEIAELYAAPQLKLMNVEQTASNGVIDYSSLDYSSFPVISQGTALQIRGEIGFSYNLSFSCVNSLPIALEPINVEIRIGQCQPGKALDLKQQCTRCRAGRYSPSGASCQDCPLGAICEMPCPEDEACEGSVGTTFPLTDVGFWENMGPRDLLEGEIQGVPIGINPEDVVQRDRASNAWWDEMHAQQGIRTDEDSDVGLEQVTGIGNQERRLSGVNDVLQSTSTERLARRLNTATRGGELKDRRILAEQAGEADTAKITRVSNQSLITNISEIDEDIDGAPDIGTVANLWNDSNVETSSDEMAAIEAIRLRQERAEEEASTTRSRSLLTDVLRTLYSVQESITLEIFQGADLDSDGQISVRKSRQTICRVLPKNVRTMLGWKGKQKSNECQPARRKRFVDGKAIASKDEFSSTCWHDERELVDDPDAGLQPKRDCVMWKDWGVTESQRMAFLLYREAPATAPRRGKIRHRAQSDRARFMAPEKDSGVSPKPLWYHESKFWYEEWDECSLCETGIKAEVDSCPLGTTAIANGLLCCSQDTDPWGLRLTDSSSEKDCGGIVTVSKWALQTETPHGFSIVLQRDTSTDDDPSNRATARIDMHALQAQVEPLCQERSRRLSSERGNFETKRHIDVLASVQSDKAAEAELHKNELKVIKECAECFNQAEDNPKVFCHRDDGTSGCETLSSDACLSSMSAFKLVQKKSECTTHSRENARHNNMLSSFQERESREDLRHTEFVNDIGARTKREEEMCKIDLSMILPVKAASAWDRQRVPDCFCSTPSLRPSWMKENRLNGIRSFYMPRESHDVGRKANLAAFPGGSARPKLELIDPETGQASELENNLLDWVHVVEDLETLRKTQDEFDMKCLSSSGRCVSDEESRKNKIKLMASERAWMDAMDRFLEESESTVESFDIDGDGNIRYEEFVESVNYRMDQSYEEIATISLEIQQSSTHSDKNSDAGDSKSKFGITREGIVSALATRWLRFTDTRPASEKPLAAGARLASASDVEESKGTPVSSDVLDSKAEVVSLVHPGFIAVPAHAFELDGLVRKVEGPEYLGSLDANRAVLKLTENADLPNKADVIVDAGGSGHPPTASDVSTRALLEAAFSETIMSTQVFASADWDDSGDLSLHEWVWLMANNNRGEDTEAFPENLALLSAKEIHEICTCCGMQSTWDKPVGFAPFHDMCDGEGRVSPDSEMRFESPNITAMDILAAKWEVSIPGAEHWMGSRVPSLNETGWMPYPKPRFYHPILAERALQRTVDRILRQNKNEDTKTWDYQELITLPWQCHGVPGHASWHCHAGPGYHGKNELVAKRDPVSAQSAYCFWNQAHCLPGEFLHSRLGECVKVDNATSTQIHECTTGMRFYRCPLGDMSCPGSDRVCRQQNRPPLVCEMGSKLPECLKCRAMEKTERAELQAAMAEQSSSSRRRLYNDGSNAYMRTISFSFFETMPQMSSLTFLPSWQHSRRSLTDNVPTTTNAQSTASDGNYSLEDALNAKSAASLNMSLKNDWESNAVCNVGYRGPMCQSCVMGYWKTPANTCEKCKTVEQDAQRGNNTFQMAVYGGGGGFAILMGLIILGLYLRQDGGTCLVYCCCPCCCKRERGGCFCCCKKVRSVDSKVVPAVVKRAHSAAFADAKLARTFRPEKFKIMLAFLQIFSQMNSNYGVNWPDVTADYMRWLSAVNIDIVRLAALDCLFRSDFYFSLILIVIMPFVGIGILGGYMIVGKALYMRRLQKNPRRCVQTGKVVVRPMNAAHFLSIRLRIAMDQTRGDDYISKKETEASIRRVMGDNKTGLPVGSYVCRGLEKNTPADRTLDRDQLHGVVRGNLTSFRERVLERIEYMRFTNKIWKLFFWLLLLIYPSISTRVLRQFACEQIGQVFVLLFDNNVQCYSFRWIGHSVVAVFGIVLFVVGIPVLFIVLLWKARNEKIAALWHACKMSPKRLEQVLKEAEADAELLREHWQLDKDGDGDPTPEEKKAAALTYLRRKNMRHHLTFERLGFLYYSYNEKHWWYEIVELSRKLFLNGVIVLVPEAVTARIMMGLMLCLGYSLMVNIVRPYSNQSDFTLQIMCHTQLFITMFAALIIKAEVPFLGFSSHLRPLEATICGWIVVLSHGIVCTWGLFGILRERFWSKEAIRLQAQKKKHAHDIKVRMSKFKRAKKKLLTKVRAGAVFGGGGLAAFGLGGVDVVGGGASDRKVTNLEQKGGEQPSSSSMLLGALMAPSTDGFRVDGNAGGVLRADGSGGDGVVNFAWPGREADGVDTGDDTDSSNGEEDENDETSDAHEGGESGSDTESGLDQTDEEQDKEETKDENSEESKGDDGADDGNIENDTIETNAEQEHGDIKKEEDAGGKVTNKVEEKQDDLQEAETVTASTKTAEDEEEAAFENAPKSVEAAKEAEKIEEAKNGGQGKEMTEAEKMVALSSDSSSSEDTSSDDDEAGF